MPRVIFLGLGGGQGGHGEFCAFEEKLKRIRMEIILVKKPMYKNKKMYLYIQAFKTIYFFLLMYSFKVSTDESKVKPSFTLK